MDPVTICNMALLAFGANSIESLDEEQIDSQEAELCSTYFNAVLRAVLEEGTPNFATGLVDLGARQDSAYASLGGEHTLVAAFVWDTSKLVRPLGCDDGSGDFTIRWERSETLIISEDTSKLFCRAVKLVTDTQLWTPNYQWAAAYKLASVVSGPITHSAAIEKNMMDKYREQIKLASRLDGMAGSTNQQFKAVSTSLATRRG